MVKLCIIGIHKYVTWTKESPYYVHSTFHKFRICEKCGRYEELVMDYYGNWVWTRHQIVPNEKYVRKVPYENSER